MEFAIELATAADSWKVAKRAEALGLRATPSNGISAAGDSARFVF